MSLSRAITHLYPAAQFILMGDDYDSLVWYGPGEQPDEQTLRDAEPAADLAAEFDKVRRAREAAYRDETDGIFFQAMRNEGDVTLDDWKDAVQAVKDAHPWPGE